MTGAIAFPAVNATSSNLKYPVIFQVLRKLLPWPFNMFDLTYLLTSRQGFPKRHHTAPFRPETAELAALGFGSEPNS